jgi:hypothetical protein
MDFKQLLRSGYTLALCLCLWRSVAAAPPPEVDPNDPHYLAGYLNVTLFSGVDPTGKTDSTAGLQSAIDSARDHGLAAFFPAGTYLVSKTLRCEQAHRANNTCGDKRRSIVIVGSTKGTKRPLIRLADTTAAFGDPTTPRPVVHILLPKVGGGERPPCAFAQIFKGVDIAVGSGNPGAVGIRLDAAQQSSFEDSTIDATGGFAGVTAVPGRGMATVNVEVRGGRYGFHLTGTSLGGSLVGVVLRDQTDAAIRAGVWRGLAVTGFLIEKDKGPVIDTQGGNIQATNLVLTDGQIRLKQPSLAIRNHAAAYLHLRNVYVEGASAVVQSGTNKTIPPATSTWTLVNEYTHCPVVKRTDVTSYNAIDGKLDQDELVKVSPVSGSPPDLVAPHVPTGIASFEDSNVVNARDLGAKGDGSTDDTEAIQQALAKHDRVFLPAGNYKISKPLQLGPSSQLFGVPGLRTRLVAASGWTASQPTWMVVTADDQQARTVLAEVSVNPPHSSSSIGAIRWRAGRESIVRSVARASGAGASMATERQIYLIDGHGGGRWYRWDSLSGGDGMHAKSRILLVDATIEPLSFYGFNPEHAKVPMVELRKATNVRIFGTKSEGKAVPVLTIQGSKNVFVAIFAGNPQSSGATFIQVEGGTDIEIAGVVRPGPHGQPLLIEVPAGGQKVQLDADEFVALFRRGQLDHGVWPLSSPGKPSETPGGGSQADGGPANSVMDSGAGTQSDTEFGSAEGGSEPDTSANGGCQLLGGAHSSSVPLGLCLLALMALLGGLARRGRAP